MTIKEFYNNFSICINCGADPYCNGYGILPNIINSEHIQDIESCAIENAKKQYEKIFKYIDVETFTKDKMTTFGLVTNITKK